MIVGTDKEWAVQFAKRCICGERYDEHINGRGPCTHNDDCGCGCFTDYDNTVIGDSRMSSKELEVVEGTVVDFPKPMSEGAARNLDKRIHLAGVRVADEGAKLLDLLEVAERGQIHIALNYPSWRAYVREAVTIAPADEFERKSMVALMSGKGMSQRDISGVVGASQATVSRDLAESGDSNGSGVTIGADEKVYPRKAKEEIIEAEWEEEPEEAERSANDVINEFRDEVDTLLIGAQAFKDVVDDELFPKARKRIAQRYQNRLTGAIADLQKIVDELME